MKKIIYFILLFLIFNNCFALKNLKNYSLSHFYNWIYTPNHDRNNENTSEVDEFLISGKKNYLKRICFIPTGNYTYNMERYYFILANPDRPQITMTITNNSNTKTKGEKDIGQIIIPEDKYIPHLAPPQYCKDFSKNNKLLPNSKLIITGKTDDETLFYTYFYTTVFIQHTNKS